MLQENSIEPSRADLRRFMAKVKINERTACWEWTAQTDRKGYGFFSVARKPQRAHRVACRWFLREDPTGFLVCHRCDNPACVNPLHLFLGDCLSNMQDCVRKGRHRNSKKTKCKRGHPFTAENTRMMRGTRRCLTCEAQHTLARWGRSRKLQALTTPLEVREG